jgi:hypothetical protein
MPAHINLIPRDGGNTFSGVVFGSFANDSMAGTNLTAELKARGLLTANSVKQNGDLNPGFGGPIAQDRVWFYTSARYLKAENWAAGMFVDKTANDPKVWSFNPDLSQPVANGIKWKDGQGRVTWQSTTPTSSRTPRPILSAPRRVRGRTGMAISCRIAI